MFTSLVEFVIDQFMLFFSPYETHINYYTIILHKMFIKLWEKTSPTNISIIKIKVLYVYEIVNLKGRYES